MRNLEYGQRKIELLRKDPYAIEGDKRRNCYICRRFGHMIHHYKNRRIIGKGRRISYEQKDNLKEEENLKTLNQALKIGLKC